MFFRSPVMRLSIPITSYPSLMNLSQRWEPKNPAAPVIKTLLFATFILLKYLQAGIPDRSASYTFIMKTIGFHL